MALYRQLKFPSTFIEYRSVSEWKGVVVISNFDSLEAALGSCLVCLGLNSPLVLIRGKGLLENSLSHWLRLFSSKPFSRINTPTFLKPSHSSHLHTYEDGTECSETSAYKIQTPGNYPEESVQHSEIKNKNR